MTIEARFTAALASPQPLWCSREAARGLLERGWGRDELLAALERFRGVLREAGRDDDEDIVLEVMDFLVGWCSPQMKV